MSMKPQTIRRIRTVVILLLLSVLVTQIWIFSNSLRDGERSSLQSNRVLEWLRPQAENLLSALGIPPTAENLSHYLRKAAHFSEYALLGFLAYCAVRFASARVPRFRWLLRLPLPFCVLTACADELLQRFVPGRSGQLKDVLLDSCGAAFGILLAVGICACLHTISQKRKRKKN